MYSATGLGLVSTPERVLRIAKSSYGPLSPKFREFWDEQGNMHAMWLPRTFRRGRAIYTLSFPQGWWIDVTSSHTLSVLDDLFPRGIQLLDKTVVTHFL